MQCYRYFHGAGLSKQLTTLRQHQRRFSFQFEFASALLQVPTLKAGASLIEHPTIYNATKRILTSIKSSHRKHLSLGRTFCSRRGHGMATAVGKSGEEKETHRSAMITGVASKSGIGWGLVEAFLAEGYRVFGVDIRPLETSAADGSEAAGSSGTAAKDGKDGTGAFCFRQADVSRPEEVRDMVEEAARFLGGKIHVVVNNAGRTNPFIAEDSDVIQEFASFVNTNLVGAFNVTAHALKHMPAGRSSVVYISSTRALQSEPHSEGYAASKAGMLGLTHAQAISLAGKVRVNAILPGWIDTSPREDSSTRYSPDIRKEDHEWQPVGRVGLPEDIAHMCIFLSDESKAGYITGQHFVVDGGVTKKMVYPE